MKITLMTLAILAFGACSGGGTEESGERDYTLDLSRYSPDQKPPALRISNETVVFPLAVGPTVQVLSGDAPGALVAHDTRVGCWVNPDEWIGQGGAVPARVPATPPVRLLEVTVDQLGGEGVTEAPRQLADRTCVSFRSQDGRWHAFAAPSIITVTGESVRTAFALDAEDANAVAIFLPTYTFVSRVSYRVAQLQR
jgi:hypothetical protein